jgi:hypothetical protein
MGITEVAQAGRLDGAQHEEGGWWPAVAPVRFYGTDDRRQSLGTSQMKKNNTRGGAHRREGVAVASRQFPVRGGRIRHQEAAPGCGGVRGRGRGRGRALLGGQTHAEDGNW